MNDAFLKRALEILDNMTDEELFEGLRKAGIDVTIRQYPEPEKEAGNEDSSVDNLSCGNCPCCMYNQTVDGSSDE